MQLNNEILITHFIRKFGRVLLKIIKNCDYCKIHFQKYEKFHNNDIYESKSSKFLDSDIHLHLPYMCQLRCFFLFFMLPVTHKTEPHVGALEGL